MRKDRTVELPQQHEITTETKGLTFYWATL